MLYLIALLPIIVYVVIIKAMDGFSIASWKRILAWFVWGFVTCGGLLLYSRWTGRDLGWYAPLVEEFLKALPLVIAVCRKKVVFFSESLIYGTAIGAGFAFLENVIYVAVLPGFTLGDAILRGFGTAVLHMGCTALYTTLAIIITRILAGKPHWLMTCVAFFSILPSFVIHYYYNQFLLPEFLQLALVILVMMGLFVVIYDIDGKLIHKWLDTCISNDVSLLASMKAGHLKETSAGRYLLDMRKKFQPEVFFDICTYLGLYLEMSIAAKSRMIMKEAGIEMPVGEAEHQRNTDNMAELKSLRNNIGLSGLMCLKPIIDEKAVDSWVLDELL